jgi:hypothetical protein
VLPVAPPPPAVPESTPETEAEPVGVADRVGVAEAEGCREAELQAEREAVWQWEGARVGVSPGRDGEAAEEGEGEREARAEAVEEGELAEEREGWGLALPVLWPKSPPCVGEAEGEGVAGGLAEAAKEGVPSPALALLAALPVL